MVKRWGVIPGLMVLLLIAGCAGETSVVTVLPEMIGQHIFGPGPGHSPSRLALHGDTLMVVLQGAERIILFDLDLNPLGMVPLAAQSRPTDIATTDQGFLISDHVRGAVTHYAFDGTVLSSFDRLPDGKTRLHPYALAYAPPVAYVADTSLGRVLAVGLYDAVNTDSGELILEIPRQGEPGIEIPSCIHVTDDGRLVVGDADNGTLQVYTCDGRFVYAFDPVPIGEPVAPQAITVDDVRDPSLLIENSSDPSGLHLQGRIHVVDSRRGQVHMFNPLGRYLGAYPGTGQLTAPSGIAIHTPTRKIYVADPPRDRIVMFTY